MRGQKKQILETVSYPEIVSYLENVSYLEII